MLFQLAEARRDKYGSKSKKSEIGRKDWRRETIEDLRGEEREGGREGERGGEERGRGGGEITRTKGMLKTKSNEGKVNREQVD